MSYSSIKWIWIAGIICIFPALSYSDSNNQYKEELQSQCLKSWLKNAGSSMDMEAYKRFGDKYCRCISAQTLNNDTAIQNAIKYCMPQTILHDAMDALEEEVTLSEVNTKTIEEYCLSRWNLIYRNQSLEDQKNISAYCACVKTKLLQFIEQIDQISNAEYNTAINDINMICYENLNK